MQRGHIGLTTDTSLYECVERLEVEKAHTPGAARTANQRTGDEFVLD
jgi:hypothetical protein